MGNLLYAELGVFLVLVAAGIYPASPQQGGNSISFDTSNLFHNRTTRMSHVGTKDRIRQHLLTNKGVSRLNDLVAYRIAHQLTHAVHVQLAHDIGAMRLDCLNAEVQRRSDFLAALALSQQLNNFPLA